jgi:hypothetical protein
MDMRAVGLLGGGLQTAQHRRDLSVNLKNVWIDNAGDTLHSRHYQYIPDMIQDTVFAGSALLRFRFINSEKIEEDII